MLTVDRPIEVSEFCFVFPSMFSLDLPVWSFRISFSCKTSRVQGSPRFFLFGRGSMFPSWREKTSGPPRRHFGKVTNSHSWWGMLNHVLTKCNSYQHLLWTSQLKSQNFVCFPVYGVSGFWYFFVLPKVGVLGTGASYDISLVLSCYNCCSNVPFSVTHNVSDEREREKERERERRHRKHLLTTV